MTKNPKIYRIDKTNRLLKSLKQTDMVIQKIINTSFKKLKYTNAYDKTNLQKIIKGETTYFLYLYKSEDIVSDWKEFLPNGLTSNKDFTQQKLSLLLFIETEFNLFSIVGGNAYQIILPFIDHSFGLNLYARIIEPEFDELLSIKSRGITGSRAGMSEQFRDNYRIIDFIKFGKVPKEIHLKLSQEVTDLHFNFIKKNKTDRVQIFVGKSFQIKKSVDFNELNKIITEIGYILELVASDYLHPELITRIFNDTENVYKRGQYSNTTFEYDFCDPNNIEKFYEADYYKLKEKTENKGYSTFAEVTDRTEIYDTVIKRGIERFGVNDRFKLMVFLQGARITSHHNKIQTTASSFLFNISTEFPINDKPIFLVDTKWYNLRDTFVQDLKTNTEHILKTYNASNEILPLKWDKKILKRESDYNSSYNSIKNYIVIDTIIKDGLELCDILHYDNENLYLIHVKYGFKSEMRELTNQITISARRLRETLGSKDKAILTKIYESLINKGKNIDNLSLSEFKDLFNKKITYVLAFTSHLKEDLSVLDNVDKFKSNIARYSLIQCSGEMRAYYYDMQTFQIRRK
jgi:hypothetical protein